MRTSVAGFVSRVALSLGLLVALVWFSGLDLSSLSFTIISLPAYGAAAALSLAGTVIVPSLLTRVALRRDRVSLSLKTLIEINLAVRFYMLVLPRPASLAIRWYRYGSSSSASDALALLIFERMVQLLIFVAGAGAFLCAAQLSGDVQAASLLIAVGAAVAILVLLTLGFLSASVLAWYQSAARMFGPFLGERLRSALARLKDAVSAFQQISATDKLHIVALGLLSYVLFVSSAWLVSKDMGLPVSVFAIAWIRPLVFIATLIPISVAGIGIREGAFVSLLSLYGVETSLGLKFALVLFSIQLLTAALGALCEVTRLAMARFRPLHAGGEE